LLRIGAGPISKASEETVALVVLLHPIETNRFIVEAPRPNEFERFIEKRIDNPQKENAIVGRDVRNGKSGKGFKI
jgi:hypothetical protein